MGTVYLVPTTDLNFNTTADITPLARLDSNQRSAYNTLLSSGFHPYSPYYTSGGSFYSNYYLLYKTGTLFYEAYYLADNGYISYWRLKLTPTWYYTLNIYDEGVLVENSGAWNDTDIGVIKDIAQNIPVANILVDYYTDRNSAYNAISTYFAKPITYRLTNCTAPTAPTEAAVGYNVEVSLSFPEGYGIVNASTDAYVTNNGVLIPSQYANGKLTFTMPDPS